MKKPSEQAYLPDVNVLIALVEQQHVGHQAAMLWRRQSENAKIYLCPLTESGFVRLMASPHVGGCTPGVALALLREIRKLHNFSHLPIQSSFLDLISPFSSRLHGYRQVTDALLLGLAIQNNATLVTLDRGVKALAGEPFAANLLTLG